MVVSNWSCIKLIVGAKIAPTHPKESTTTSRPSKVLLMTAPDLVKVEASTLLWQRTNFHMELKNEKNKNKNPGLMFYLTVIITMRNKKYQRSLVQFNMTHGTSMKL